MRVRLNLATKPLVTHRRFLVGSAAIAIVAGIVFLAMGAHVYSARKAEAAMRAKMETIRIETADLQARRAQLEKFFALPENAKLSDRAAYLNSIIGDSSLNWTQMFMDLEHVMPGGVRLLSISPKMIKGNMEVKLRVGAVSDEAKLRFLHSLEGSKTFRNVVLLSEQVPSQQGSDQTVLELNVVYARS